MPTAGPRGGGGAGGTPTDKHTVGLSKLIQKSSWKRGGGSVVRLSWGDCVWQGTVLGGGVGGVRVQFVP